MGHCWSDVGEYSPCPLRTLAQGGGLLFASHDMNFQLSSVRNVACSCQMYLFLLWVSSCLQILEFWVQFTLADCAYVDPAGGLGHDGQICSVGLSWTRWWPGNQLIRDHPEQAHITEKLLCVFSHWLPVFLSTRLASHVIVECLWDKKCPCADIDCAEHFCFRFDFEPTLAQSPFYVGSVNCWFSSHLLLQIYAKEECTPAVPLE